MGHETTQSSWESLSTLISGLAEAEFGRGEQFVYDGARLYPEDVADMLLPSILCLAQGVARYVDMGDFGYDFDIEPESQGAFPLQASPKDRIAPFHLIAPFVVEAFDSYVIECRADVAKVFEAAAQLIYPDFALERNTRVGRGLPTSIQTQGPKG